jgi:hypothetical protein
MEHLPFAEALGQYDVTHCSARQQLETALQETYHEIDPESSDIYPKVCLRYQQDQDSLAHLTELSQQGLEESDKCLSMLDKQKTVSDSMQSRLKKMDALDAEIQEMSVANPLINDFIKQDIFVYAQAYGRKLAFTPDEAVTVGDVEALRENLETSKLLYQAIIKGCKRLLDTLAPVFEDFPGATTSATAPVPPDLSGRPQKRLASTAAADG